VPHRRTLPAVLLALALLALPLAVPAAAHGEFRSGPLTFDGFGLTNEPVKVGEWTQFEFTVTRGGKPVRWSAAEQERIKIHVFVGVVKPSPELAAQQPTPDGKPMILSISEQWDTPGSYLSEEWKATNPGDLTAHLHSPIAGIAGAKETVKVDGLVIDVVAPTGPETYSAIERGKTFPLAEPTMAELAGRQAAQAARAQGYAAEVDDRLDSTGTLLLGLGAVAALALLLAVLALFRARRRPVPPSPEVSAEAERFLS
jgi:hypothetical protein